MATPSDQTEILPMLSELKESLARLREEQRRTGETVTRLKLMSDNARRQAEAQAETLKAIEESLARLEGR